MNLHTFLIPPSIIPPRPSVGALVSNMRLCVILSALLIFNLQVLAQTNMELSTIDSCMERWPEAGIEYGYHNLYAIDQKSHVHAVTLINPLLRPKGFTWTTEQFLADTMGLNLKIATNRQEYVKTVSSKLWTALSTGFNQEEVRFVKRTDAFLANNPAWAGEVIRNLETLPYHLNVRFQSFLFPPAEIM